VLLSLACQLKLLPEELNQILIITGERRQSKLQLNVCVIVGVSVGMGGGWGGWGWLGEDVRARVLLRHAVSL
jgi:hypothetical protein